MGIFGWDLPPGCSINDLPGSQPTGCDICGKDEDSCICPECPTCGAVGDLNCYIDHGLIMSKEQQESLAEANRLVDEQNKREAGWDND